MSEGTPKYYLALPQSGEGAGVLVLHAWWGLNDFIRRFCDRLAQEGFAALAPDLFSGRVASTIGEAEQLNSQLNEAEDMPPLVLSAYEELSKHTTGEALGTIGFSLGAYWARWLAQEKPESIRAVTIFYSDGWNVQPSQAAYLGHFAETDPYISEEEKKQLQDSLKALNRPTTFYTYQGTGHWFMEDDRPEAYNPGAAQLAWDRTIAFLRKQLAGESSPPANPINARQQSNDKKLGSSRETVWTIHI
jgi:carboxymethylenebutenolidase